MDFLASVVSSAVGEIGRSICGRLYACVKNTMSFQSNHDALENKMRSLRDIFKKNKQAVEVAEIDGKSRTTKVANWLTDVQRINDEVQRLLNGTRFATVDGEFCGSFSSCTVRYRFGMQVAKKLKEVERLLQDSDFSAGVVSDNSLPKPVRHMPGASIEDKTTASKTLDETMKRLRKDGVRRIGIWGMGGVGKSTLARTLNNMLESSSSKQPSGTVIWVAVSKDLDLKGIQTQIARRLKLKESLEGRVEELAILLHERLMKEKEFVLILDDVWEPINLHDLGIPKAEEHKGYKIILTSRSFTVCEGMRCNEKVKVNVLNDKEAWKLFIENAGRVASSKLIKPFAKAVANECNGLPLALITVGSAMRGKEKVELWQDALNELRRSEPNVVGIESKVYTPLRWSYDKIEGKNIKSCFLYCSLFPEDFSIEESELVQCWLGEGLIDEELSYEDSRKRGIAIVENLKHLCLLEQGGDEHTVKMHDVIRDVAIWIASSDAVEDGCKSHVRSGRCLSQITNFRLLKSCNRISFMKNSITSLPNENLQCSDTSTLLLQVNPPLQNVPESFLEGFPALSVLNLSGTKIESLPRSLTKLSKLQALFLQSCVEIKKLPPLGGLRNLRVLNLSATNIRELPEGMGELSNLRLLDLSWTRNLNSIQAGVLTRLSRLEVLDMSESAYRWGVKENVEEGQQIFEDLKPLNVLNYQLKTERDLGLSYSHYSAMLGSPPCSNEEKGTA